MKKTIVILAALVFCVSSLVCAEEDSTKKYKPAPLPHYTEEKGYGWDTEVPVIKPEHVWHILKVWRTTDTFSVFVDTDKDGKCDVVYEFGKDGTFSAKGEPMVIRLPDRYCKPKEEEIKYFLDRKENEIDL